MKKVNLGTDEHGFYKKDTAGLRDLWLCLQMAIL